MTSKISKKARRAKFKLTEQGNHRARRGVHGGLSAREIQRDLKHGKNRRRGMSSSRAWFITLKAILFK